MTSTDATVRADVLAVPHIVKGELVRGRARSYGRFVTPELDLDSLVWGRQELGPAFDVAVAEVIDLLDEVGRRLDPDTNPWLRDSLDQALRDARLSPRLIEYSYRGLGELFSRRSLEFQLESELGAYGSGGWVAQSDPWGGGHHIRAFPPRLAHVVAGNTPGTAAVTIVRGALTRGVNLMKLGSDDLLTASAILRTMAEVAPGHPTTKSFTAVYWRGGDAEIEGALFRPQYFDKIVAWGGEAAIRNALSYVGPGIELVAFDPKVSISLVGREAFASPEAMRESAVAAATDSALYNQNACASSRFIYAEGTPDELAPWCRMLAQELGVDRALSDGSGVPVPGEVRAAVEAARFLEPEFQVLGSLRTGVVVLSSAPVDFHPDGKVVNVVAVPSLDEAVSYVNVATQTIGIYPAARAPELRDRLAAAGMQRLVALGAVATKVPGVPHDGFYPLQRLVRWLVDDSG
ncbi:long-chain-fatty-acyl-CoA reductase [Frankia sp. CNm7]|uniref:Long-chain-fatty-acyl-CoA reductase n=1 Tax=Frankia nepalensis TaxID=1836974 RepID=A0A937UR54_9ACTN|nr:acyl-CoA reductase [Frankia nepalensis]MBL7496652.1 long-chain-fatty-acyl-CoA reductase [Frankia nepalensis]MBL7510706.1 long-chain-fatty-acyl-CoA reductase [Frankia nepalensis]MBL7516661.1 long-chain-fatty-acyl-CoA reductase [Frankia nepalensis]MBL7627391.1 long-chain-fatty-acyl-CoA reductase [Frankia nepalensis]